MTARAINTYILLYAVLNLYLHYAVALRTEMIRRQLIGYKVAVRIVGATVERFPSFVYPLDDFTAAFGTYRTLFLFERLYILALRIIGAREEFSSVALLYHHLSAALFAYDVAYNGFARLGLVFHNGNIPFAVLCKMLGIPAVREVGTR